MDATRSFYEVAHRVGFRPWEMGIEHPPFASTLIGLLDDRLPTAEGTARALELGCGSGIWTAELARRGWHVTGVDTVEPALRRARARLESCGLEAELVAADVAALDPLRIGTGYELILDTGTFHGLADGARAACAASLARLAAPAATTLLLAWAPGRRGPLPRGVSRRQIERDFAGWRLEYVTSADSDPPPLLRALRADARWYRLRRRSEGR